MTWKRELRDIKKRNENDGYKFRKKQYRDLDCPWLDMHDYYREPGSLHSKIDKNADGDYRGGSLEQ
jgi:hypothetical protein